MQENSFEWFNAQVENAKNQAEGWPEWMKNTADFATASFPIINTSNGGNVSNGTRLQTVIEQEK